jgi:hypothetical protein
VIVVPLIRAEQHQLLSSRAAHPDSSFSTKGPSDFADKAEMESKRGKQFGVIIGGWRAKLDAELATKLATELLARGLDLTTLQRSAEQVNPCLFIVKKKCD